jgi:CheY-like chemotaxis protein
MPCPLTFGTLLIVEGDVTLGKVLKRALGRDGLTILHAVNSAEALQLAEQHRPRLVLLDCSLRSDDGLELAAELQRRFSSLPVIAMADVPLSGHAGSITRGCFARVLTKSVNLPDLRQAVDAVLGARNTGPDCAERGERTLPAVLSRFALPCSAAGN